MRGISLMMIVLLLFQIVGCHTTRSVKTIEKEFLGTYDFKKGTYVKLLFTDQTQSTKGIEGYIKEVYQDRIEIVSGSKINNVNRANIQQIEILNRSLSAKKITGIGLGLGLFLLFSFVYGQRVQQGDFSTLPFEKIPYRTHVEKETRTESLLP